jgi:hypothetical protein
MARAQRSKNLAGHAGNLECVVKLDEFCLARSCYLSKAKRERDSLARPNGPGGLRCSIVC